MASQTLLAAQPIYSRDSQIVAVELLYRDDVGQSALAVGEHRATSEVLFNFCAGITDHASHYNALAYINVAADLLLSGLVLPVDPDRVMIELVERIEPTPELVAAVQHWYDQGFRFALDDFAFLPSWAPLLPLASVIKVDVTQFTAEVVAHHKQELDHLDVLWLAERVEDQVTRDRFMDMGFDLFQGYFMARPQLISGQKLSPSGLRLTQLLAVLFRPEPEVSELTNILSADPELSLNLIRIVNSPLYRGHGKISSIREVVIRLGITNLRHWATMLSSLQMVNTERARVVLVRAHVCEALAGRIKISGPEPDKAFLAGLLSGTGVMLGVPVQEFINRLDLEQDVRKAVLHRKGSLGRLLKLAITMEHDVAMGRDLENWDPRLLKLYRQAANRIQRIIRQLDRG